MDIALAASQAIERIAAPSRSDFVRRYLKPGQPVVLRGAMDDWKALSCWSPDYLVNAVGAKPVTVQTSPSGIFGIDPERGGPRYQELQIEFRDYVHRILSPDPAQPRLYLQRSNIPTVLPELMPDFALPSYVTPDQVYLINLWFGPGGNITPLHYDVPNNFLAQVYGRKRFILFPPRQSSDLYPYRTKSYNLSQVDLDRPDFEKFPRLVQARPLETTLEPGDMLFVPSFWWHQVYSLDTAMTVNFWWLPRWRQYLAPQIFDCLGDILSEARRLLPERLHLSKPRQAGAEAGN